MAQYKPTALEQKWEKQATAPLPKDLAVFASTVTVPMNFQTQQRTEKPDHTNKNMVFDRARYYARESSWLQMFLPMKKFVFNYGLTIRAGKEKGKKADASAREKLAEWLDTPSTVKFEPYTDPATQQTIEPEVLQTNRELISNFIDEAWDERLALNNVVSFWTDGLGYPVTLQPEKCRFTDVFGVPILYFMHGLDEKQIATLPSDQQELFRGKSEILVDPGAGMHFKVLKNARVGEGFGLPRLFSIFRLLGEVESKEYGFNLLSFALRTVTRWHKLGHEIKNGDRAGKPFWFWRPERSKNVLKIWQDKIGFNEYTSNFDETIEYPWPDLKQFDETAWKGTNWRLNIWGGPLAFMLHATQAMPYLAPLLRAEALAERSKFGQYITTVINSAFGTPVPIELAWSNTIFNEARLQAELIKFGYQQGLVSATTGQSEIGVDPQVEADLKVEEAADPDATAKLYPHWDSSHGFAPSMGDSAIKMASVKTKATGKDPGSTSGKPPGTSDKS